MSPEASFVFEGTVVAVGASTLPAIEADERTAIVRVDRILRAPEAMEGIAGREITVRLRSTAKPGASATFRAEGWIYGESMAVVETGRRRAGQRELSAAADNRESPAAADRAARFRKELKERAKEAAAVVLAHVTGVQETRAPAGGRLSEHDPRWAVATVEVDRAVKGRPAKKLKVLFATSEDVMWRQAPKLAVGQQAVMLLQKGAPEVPDKQAHAVLDELDVQPPDTADVVADLL